MYHLIVTAILTIGSPYQYTESYYNTKAECYNEKLKLPEHLESLHNKCKFIESCWEWTIDKQILKKCKKEDDIIELKGECREE